MHVLFEYILLILMPYPFWSLGKEMKIGGIVPLIGLFFFWWLFSSVETPFLWPIATGICAFLWTYYIAKFFGNIHNVRAPGQLSGSEIAEAIRQTQLQAQFQEQPQAQSSEGNTTQNKESEESDHRYLKDEDHGRHRNENE